MAQEPLSRYDQATVSLWQRSYRELDARPGAWLAIAAAHAVLAGLRRCTTERALLACYEADTAADFGLIRSLLAEGPSEELLWQVREAAYHLRWRELTGEAR